jgi:hypothetical protein
VRSRALPGEADSSTMDDVPARGPRCEAGGRARLSATCRLERARALPDVRAPARCDDSAVSLTVLIVDDHEEFRRVARVVLEAGGLDVVGEAPDGASAVAEAARLRPRLVLVDIQLPDSDGVGATHDVARTRILVAVTRRGAAVGATPAQRMLA